MSPIFLLIACYPLWVLAPSSKLPGTCPFFWDKALNWADTAFLQSNGPCFPRKEEYVTSNAKPYRAQGLTVPKRMNFFDISCSHLPLTHWACPHLLQFLQHSDLNKSVSAVMSTTVDRTKSPSSSYRCQHISNLRTKSGALFFSSFMWTDQQMKRLNSCWLWFEVKFKKTFWGCCD